MRTRQTGSRPAFTLIELLVVITLVTLLLSLLLPVLYQARNAARGTACLSSLRSIGLGWTNGLADRGDRIPHTFNPSNAPNWVDVLNDIYPDVPNLNNAAWNGLVEDRSFNACPQVQAGRQPVYYPSTQWWGYTVNSAWLDAPNDINCESGNRWADVRRPSSYPFFMDGELEPFANGYHMTHRVPRIRTATMWQQWGVGTPHLEGEGANVWFAGGNASTVVYSEIEANVAGGGSYRWFENR